MKKLIKGMIMVLLAVFMLISNADANAWKVHGTVVDAPEGTVVGIWRLDCGGMSLIGNAIPDEDGYYEKDWLGKGEYIILPYNDEIIFAPESISIAIPYSKSVDFVVEE